MNSRANRPDTAADIELQSCIESLPPRSFIMTAGAGSGKTTSLIKGLTYAVQLHGDMLRNSRQRIACITYTDIAAREIWRDVGNDPLVHVSTIHSFIWLLVKPFQFDIRQWVSGRIGRRIDEIKRKQINYSPRVHTLTKEKDSLDLERLQRLPERIADVKSFRYGKGSDYANGILGHDDILKIGPSFITEHPLFRVLLAQQFPFVFVDESQDTTTEMIDALKSVECEPGVRFCLGFFGDPMQRIYVTGTGKISAPPDWLAISKAENFRCSTNVLKLANAIRQGGDRLTQVSGKRVSEEGARTSTDGAAHLFVLPTDNNRDNNIAKVRRWMAAQTGDDNWRVDHQEHVKHLVIVHQMAAKRLGFGDLYTALNKNAPTAFRDGFLDGTAWPLSPCVSFLIPLAVAHSEGRQLEVMRLLRSYSPLLEKDNLSHANVAELLERVREIVTFVAASISSGSSVKIGELLAKVSAGRVLDFDPRFASYLDSAEGVANQLSQLSAGIRTMSHDEADKELVAMSAYLECPASQLLAYQNYISEQSPFWTQQGIKGAEFERVLVVLDDEESTHAQFSYEKYLGLKDLSESDHKRSAAGDETIVDRTRRLFYVCCTRALKDLAVVLFTAEPGRAANHIRQLALFDDDAIHTEKVFNPQ